MRLILKDRLYIPAQCYRKDESLRMLLKEHFVRTIVNPNLCIVRIRGGNCERQGSKCYSCSSAKLKIDMIKKHPLFVSVPRGDLRLIYKLFAGNKIVDKTKFPERPKDFDFDWKVLREEQKSVIDEWLEYEFGQIVCPPRFGKTILCAAITSKLKTRVGIFTHQGELLDQFYKTYEKFTNIFEISKLHGHRLIAINPRMEEIPQLSVCLFTYQKFMPTYGKERLKTIKNLLGCVVVDEVHRGAANNFHQIIDSINSRVRLGLTATPERKDGLHFKTNLVIGPPIITSVTEQLDCKVYKHDTDIYIADTKVWPSLINRISKHAERNDLIVEQIALDVKNGYRVVVPVERVEHVHTLVDMLKKKLPEYTKEIMPLLANAVNRKDVVDRAKNSKLVVLVATRKLVSLGLDVPPISCIYEILPIANEQNFYQEISRIRTPFKKKDPIVRIFVDDNGASQACYKICKRVFDRLGFPIEEGFNLPF